MKKRKRKCVGCGKKGKDVTLGAEPFNQDMNGDDTPVWMCEDCRTQSAWDI